MASITIDPKAVFAYLGMSGKMPDPALSAQVSACIRLVEQASNPRTVYRSFPLITKQSCCVPGGTTLLLTGNDIHTHLAGCQEVLLMAITLGTAVETLLMRTQVSNVANAMIMDACASVAVETVAEELTTRLKAEYRKRGQFLTGRFSPGYGDLPLELQDSLLEVLNTRRAIGLTVSKSSILLPRKSITAILGISDTPHEGKPAGCENCAMRDKCRYKKEGTTCES